METEVQPSLKESIIPEELEEETLLDEEDNVILEDDEDKNDDISSGVGNRWIFRPRVGWYTKFEDFAENYQASHEGGDPYDTFMRRHLQHYGYFTGRNASFRNNYEGLEEWHRNYDLRLSGTQSLSMDEDQMKKLGHFPPSKNNNYADPNYGQFFSEGQPPDELLSRTTQLVFHYQAGRKIPKLREPRNLYALTKEPGPQQATRWPSHMQVVSSSVRFIEYEPSTPDPFYVPTGKEPTPAVRGTPTGEIVYLNDPGRDMYFMRSRVAGCRLAMRDVSLTPRDTVDEGNFTLEFESRFESGNLLKVVKINDFEYELTLRPDLYTDKHTQWFFFRVRNMVPDKKYRLTVVNLMKPTSLYNNGMKPLFYSETNAKKSKIGWTRAGCDIRYYRNNLGSMSGRTFYSLTWTIEFPHKDDTCYFAHCYPYTYTDLQEYLLRLANDPVRSRYCKQRVLCRTLAGNLVYILTITSPSRNPEIARSKKAVVITARVHPGETNASWMMKGFLDFLSGNSADAKLLRDNFIFKIVPMLNPDGVIVGNYRCSLAGRDLNRNYKSVLKDSFPSVWHLKMMVKKLNMEREIVLYCDLHGHSRKNNIFIYGCENKNNPQRKFKERIFPLMLSKNANTKFSYESCKFKVQKSKEGTGRVVMWCMGIMNSYTMEATFGGTSLGSRKGTHFSSRDLEEMGHNFCDTLLDYCDPDTSKLDACYQEIQDRVRKQIFRRMQMKNMQGSIGDVDLDDFSSEYESDTSGSDSSCDDGLPVHLLAIAPKLQRKRRLKTRRDRNKQVVRKSSAPVQDEAKPTPSHGAKPADKPKPVRYSQTAGAKRRDDQAHVAVGTGNSFQEERATKKENQPLQTNKATFVQFAPPHKLVTNAAILQQQKFNVEKAKTVVTGRSLFGPAPTCVRTRSLECSRLKQFVKAISERVSAEEQQRLQGDGNYRAAQAGTGDLSMQGKDQKPEIYPSRSVLDEATLSSPPEGMNLSQIMKYSVNHDSGDDSFLAKPKLVQPTPNFQKQTSKTFKPASMKYSHSSMKSTRMANFGSRPQTEPSRISQKNLPVIRDPDERYKFNTDSNQDSRETPRKTNTAYWNHSPSTNPCRRPVSFVPVSPDVASKRTLRGDLELLRHLRQTVNRISYCPDDSAVPRPVCTEHSCEPAVVHETGRGITEKILRFMQARRARALMQSREKFQVYEPRIAMSLRERRRNITP